MENMKFDGEVAVITGAGGGLGRAYALEFARRGAKVVVNDLGGAADGTGQASHRPAESVVAEIETAGGRAIPSFASVATPEGAREIIDTAIATWGRVDALVSNAGILRDRSFARMEVEDLDAVLDVNLRGSFFIAGPAFRAMKDSGRGGRLLLTTSASGLFGNFGQAGYAAAKMGIVGLTRVLAIEGQKSGIRVNAIAPMADTRLTGRGDHPAPSRGPDRVVPLAVYLCHASNHSTGEVYMAGWGWYSRAAMFLGQGWKSGESGTPSVESIAAHWEQIRDLSGAREIVDARGIIDHVGEHIPRVDSGAAP